MAYLLPKIFGQFAVPAVNRLSCFLDRIGELTTHPKSFWQTEFTTAKVLDKYITRYSGRMMTIGARFRRTAWPAAMVMTTLPFSILDTKIKQGKKTAGTFEIAYDVSTAIFKTGLKLLKADDVIAFDDGHFVCDIGDEQILYDADGTRLTPKGPVVLSRGNLKYLYTDGRLERPVSCKDGYMLFVRGGEVIAIDYKGQPLGTTKIIPSEAGRYRVSINGRLYFAKKIKDGTFLTFVKNKAALYSANGEHIPLNENIPIYYKDDNDQTLVIHEGDTRAALTARENDGFVYAVDKRNHVVQYKIGPDGDEIVPDKSGKYFSPDEDVMLFDYRNNFVGASVNGDYFYSVCSNDNLAFLRSSDRVIAIDLTTGRQLHHKFGKDRIIDNSDGLPAVIIKKSEAYVIIDGPDSAGNIAFAVRISGGMEPASSANLKVFRIQDKAADPLLTSDIRKLFRAQMKGHSGLTDADIAPSQSADMQILSQDNATQKIYEVSVVLKDARIKTFHIDVPDNRSQYIESHLRGACYGISMDGPAHYMTQRPDILLNGIRTLPSILSQMMDGIVIEPFYLPATRLADNKSYVTANYSAEDGALRFFRVLPKLTALESVQKTIAHEIGHKILYRKSALRRMILLAIIADGKKGERFMREQTGRTYCLKSSAEFFCEAIPEYVKDRELFTLNLPATAALIEDLLINS